MKLFSASRARKDQPANRNLRRASELSDIQELNLNHDTSRRIRDGNLSVDSLVKFGRDHYMERFGSRALYRSWPDVLSAALDKAGFIRHDINERTFRVGRLYRRVYIMSGLDTSRIFTSYDEITSNRRYESCQLVTEESFHNLMEYLDVALGRRDARVIKLLYGLENGNIWTYGEIGDLYQTTGQHIRQISRRCLRTLVETGLPLLQYPSL